jgi:4-hydroxy-tetrahydrodipicolinate synthase
MEKFKWAGVFPAITTFFTSYDKLDLAIFEKNLSAQIDAGIDAVVLGGTLGESNVLAGKEKEQLIRSAMAKVAGRIPVVLNIAEGAAKEAVAAAKMGATLGINGLMLLRPCVTNQITVKPFLSLKKWPIL